MPHQMARKAKDAGLWGDFNVHYCWPDRRARVVSPDRGRTACLGKKKGVRAPPIFYIRERRPC